jgi:hypothetical protein
MKNDKLLLYLVHIGNYSIEASVMAFFAQIGHEYHFGLHFFGHP